jgi:hypothetical protein
VSRFVVDSDASRLTAHARSTVHALTYRAPLTGEIEATPAGAGGFDLAQPISGVLEVDLAQVRGDDRLTEAEMRRRLEVKRHPHVKAVIDRVTAAGTRDGFHLGGQLSLHGRTVRLEGDAVVTLDGDRMHATGSVTLDVREFGIRPPSLVLVRVNPAVVVEIDLFAVRSGFTSPASR